MRAAPRANRERGARLALCTFDHLSAAQLRLIRSRAPCSFGMRSDGAACEPRSRARDHVPAIHLNKKLGRPLLDLGGLAPGPAAGGGVSACSWTCGALATPTGRC
eukprot:5891962-Alexandrium_andersonii.AAC.1